jgi:hypothetical protein
MIPPVDLAQGPLPRERPGGFSSVSKWIGSNLEMDHFGVGPFSRLAVVRRAGTPCGPDSFSLPARFRIVEASVHPFGIEAHRIRYAQYRELPVHQGEQRIGRIARDDRRVLAQAVAALKFDGTFRFILFTCGSAAFFISLTPLLADQLRFSAK